MQSDERMHEATRRRASATGERRPPGFAAGGRGRAHLPRVRRRIGALTAGAHALVALLLLLLMPLGQLHKSSTFACGHAHRAAVTATVAAATNDFGLGASITAAADHERTVGGDRHDHRPGDLPLDGAAPSGCGPAAPVAHPVPASATPSGVALPDWRALPPLALAAPPPAPPPRLS